MTDHVYKFNVREIISNQSLYTRHVYVWKSAGRRLWSRLSGRSATSPRGRSDATRQSATDDEVVVIAATAKPFARKAPAESRFHQIKASWLPYYKMQQPGA